MSVASAIFWQLCRLPDSAAECLTRTSWTQKMFDRPFNELSIDVKTGAINLKTIRLFLDFGSCLSTLCSKQWRNNMGIWLPFLSNRWRLIIKKCRDGHLAFRPRESISSTWFSCWHLLQTAWKRRCCRSFLLTKNCAADGGSDQNISFFKIVWNISFKNKTLDLVYSLNEIRRDFLEILFSFSINVDWSVEIICNYKQIFIADDVTATWFWNLE